MRPYRRSDRRREGGRCGRPDTQLRKEIDNEWYLILCGVISVLFGIGVMIMPGAGALALIWVIGIYAIVEGILYIALAFRLKKHVHT